MMDESDIPPWIHQQALRGLARLNRWTRIASDLYPYLRRQALKTPARPLRILDVASGSGDLPITWARRAKREGLDFRLTTIDRSETAIRVQQRDAMRRRIQIASINMDCINEPLPLGFDVVTNSLFMHHLSDDDATTLIRSMQRAAESQVLICDLERTRTNLGLVNAGARLLSRSNIVHNDADLSVRAAYTTQEFARLIHSATGRTVPVRRIFPCRFVASFTQPLAECCAPSVQPEPGISNEIAAELAS